MIDKFAGQYKFLNNFYIHEPITYKGMTCDNVEALFQACKVLNQTERDYIVKQGNSNPSRAKQLGKAVELRLDWEQVKDDIMQELLKIKFNIPALKSRLLKTNNEMLIEGNWWHDTYWGMCNGVGKNKLGRLLMKLRRQLQSGRKNG